MAEINPENTRLFNQLKLRFIEWIAVVISSVACLVVILTGLFTTYSLGHTAGTIDQQNIRIQALDSKLNQKNEELLTQFNVYKLRDGRLDAYLKAHGVPVEEIYSMDEFPGEEEETEEEESEENEEEEDPEEEN